MVTWSEPAKDDLKSVFDYIKEDSVFYAERLVELALKKSEIINDFPKAGRIVPEFADENRRELFVYSYRMIYRITHSDIIITAFIHGARNLTSEEFSNI
ncbi:MAG: type II toxin-antitoxin system RelE/ParE family toxin [bacterium]